MALNVVGSNPTTHPIFLPDRHYKDNNLPIQWKVIVRGYSQVGKAPDFDSGMRRFESCYPCHFIRAISSVGRALDF